jgi:hypothetical protein
LCRVALLALVQVLLPAGVVNETKEVLITRIVYIGVNKNLARVVDRVGLAVGVGHSDRIILLAAPPDTPSWQSQHPPVLGQSLEYDDGDEGGGAATRKPSIYHDVRQHPMDDDDEDDELKRVGGGDASADPSPLRHVGESTQARADRALRRSMQGESLYYDTSESAV